jgi:predicted phosphodiesterase
MKIGIITDIHGRYEALVEVLHRLHDMGAIINLGDVADFSSRVNDCYDLLKQKKILNLIGNHEQEVLSTGDEAEIELLDETGNVLSQDFGVNEENKQFIRNSFKLGMSIKKDGLTCHFSHGHRVTTGRTFTFEYLSDVNIPRHYEFHKANINFCGHLHKSQLIEVHDKGVTSIQEVECSTIVRLYPSIIYGFNVGMLSRGKEKSGRLRYAVLNTNEKTVEYVIE